MCTIDCPLCEIAVRFEPGDDEFDCPTCAVGVAVLYDEPVRLAMAA